MRVAYVTQSFNGHDQRFITALTSAGIRVGVVSLALETSVLAPLVTVPGPRIGLATGTSPTTVQLDEAAGRLHAWPWLRDADLVHAGPLPDAAYIATRASSAPVIGMAWGYDILRDVLIDVAAAERARYALARVSGFIADCHTVLRAAVELGLSTVTPSAVFPWGIDLSAFHMPTPAPRERDGRFTVLSQRAWEPMYRVPLVLDAFEVAAERDDSLHLLLAGRGSLAQSILRRLEKEPLRGRVTVVGQVSASQMADLCTRSDLAVSASEVDGTSISMLEALACGVPVVVTDSDANREWVVEGVHGWLVDPADTEALARRLIAAAADPAATAAMADDCRRLVESRADWREGTVALLGLYDTVCGVSR